MVQFVLQMVKGKYWVEKLSVFFPAYNEEANLRETVEKALPVLGKVAETFEVIVVDDGSKDKTGEVAADLARKHKEVRVVTNNPNRGYGGALKVGFAACKYAWVVFTDADGQFDIGETSSFFEKQKETGADLVIGYYRKRKVGVVRKMGSWLWQFVVWLLFGLRVRDTDCGFKLFKKSAIEEWGSLEAERGAFITSEYLVKAKRRGQKIAEVPVTHYARKAGKATGASLAVILSSYKDLISLWWKMRK